ncbi:hypothetical protein [Pseudovibrio sp. Ad26]|uniref:phage fiber-tail adaptor protein n=1 Tax=Pseudovibrio sp. Ad26 TaxID=989410 RepID=UPI0007AEB35E|nr:hypothetical protein [Pseudovibrio sp. Ad26]KZK99134.1 hypothetical protein PsAD26_04943 [Pseudovibrio sp. Ad26]
MTLTWKAPKDPDDVKDYKLDWSARLGDMEEITSSEWLVPLGVTKGSDSHTQHVVTIWLRDGTAGEKYRITNRVQTSQGRTYDQSVVLHCYES